MKRASDTRVMLGAVGIAGAVLLAGALVASAMLRADFEPASATAAEPAPAQVDRTTPAESPNAAVAAQPAAGAEPEARSAQSAPLTRAPSQLSSQVLVLAAERAPFDPERQAPAGRYLFPEERVVPAPPPEPEPPPTPPFRVVGAVAGLPGAGPGRPGGIAIVQPDGQQPKILQVGEEFMGYRISSVEPNVVVASSRGWDVSIPVEALQATRMGANTRNTRNADQQARNATREVERVVNQLRERLEVLGGQAGEGAVQFDAPAGNGQFRFQMQDGRAIITGPNGQRQEIRIPAAGGGGMSLEAEKIIVAPAGRRPGGGR
jgi:hypothetical protein